MTRFGHTWAPITELDTVTRSHRAPSSSGLAQAWREERDAMQGLDVERLFLERYENRLAVEATGCG